MVARARDFVTMSKKGLNHLKTVERQLEKGTFCLKRSWKRVIKSRDQRKGPEVELKGALRLIGRGFTWKLNKTR